MEGMLASIGRGYSTFQFIVAIIVSIGLIAGGIYLLSTPPSPSQTPSIVPPPFPGAPSVPGMPAPGSNAGRVVGGSLMIVLGILSPIAAWIRRKLIRSNPTLATLAGALDVAKFIPL